MIRTIKSVGIAASLFALSSTAGFAEEAMGQAVFTQYCATCHGASGTGDGPLTEMITSKVPDLTKISMQNDGEFPMLDVIHIIDGRTDCVVMAAQCPHMAPFSRQSLSMQSLVR